MEMKSPDIEAVTSTTTGNPATADVDQPPAGLRTVLARLGMSTFTTGYSTEKVEDFLLDVKDRHAKYNLPFTVAHYFMQLFTTIIIATVICLVPLVMPLNMDFTTNYVSGWAYWFVYNGGAGLVYGMSTFYRLGGLMPKYTETGDFNKHVGLLDPKCMGVAALAALLLSGGFIAVDAIVCAIANVPSPAPGMLVYAAPINLVLVDQLTNLLHPRPKGEHLKHVIGIVVYSLCVGAPLLFMLVPVFLGSIVEIRSVIAVVFVVIGWPHVKQYFFLGSKFFLNKFYFGRLTGVTNKPEHYMSMRMLYDMYAGMACLLLFPFQDLTSINVLLLQCVNVYRGQKAKVAAIIYTAKKLSSAEGKATTGVMKRNSQVFPDEVLSKFGGELGAANVAAPLAIPMFELINSQITNLAPSFVYLIMTAVIFWRGNKGAYYVYECMTFNDWLQSTIIVGVKFCWDILNTLDDLRLLKNAGLFQPYLKLAIYTHDMTRMNLALTIAVISVIFTSCFYIKYDGVFFLSNVAQCNGIVDWRTDVWVDGINTGSVASLVAAGTYPQSF